MTIDAYPIDAEGVWCQTFAASLGGRPALFLDRDGVVVEEVGYLHKADDVVLCPGAGAVIAAANVAGVPVVLVTNQAGIGRGYYGWKEFQDVQRTIGAALALQQARFDAVYACPHHADGKGPYAHPNHPARKPNPGMLTRAAQTLGIDLPRSWLVGDRAIDVEAARRAGLAGAMLVQTGYGSTEVAAAMTFRDSTFDVKVARRMEEVLALPIFHGH